MVTTRLPKLKKNKSFKFFSLYLIRLRCSIKYSEKLHKMRRSFDPASSIHDLLWLRGASLHLNNIITCSCLKQFRSGLKSTFRFFFSFTTSSRKHALRYAHKHRLKNTQWDTSSHFDPNPSQVPRLVAPAKSGLCPIYFHKSFSVRWAVYCQTKRNSSPLCYASVRLWWFPRLGLVATTNGDLPLESKRIRRQLWLRSHEQREKTKIKECRGKEGRRRAVEGDDNDKANDDERPTKHSAEAKHREKETHRRGINKNSEAEHKATSVTWNRIGKEWMASGIVPGCAGCRNHAAAHSLACSSVLLLLVASSSKRILWHGRAS